MRLKVNQDVDTHSNLKDKNTDQVGKPLTTNESVVHNIS